jgi:phosphohistidine phosphatase
MPLVSLLSDVVCHGFNARIFDTADVLMINYDFERSSGSQLGFYQSLT